MSKQIRTITVYLDQDYHDEGIKEILNAIGMIKGVAHTAPQVVEFQDYDNRLIATLELRRKVFEALDAALPLIPK